MQGRERAEEQHRAAVRARLLKSDHAPAGPGSVTWKINREVIVLASWGRAILLQLAHPAVAAGVHDHSEFRGSLLASLRRLRSTTRAMLALTFGNTEAVIAAAARINSVHDRVRGAWKTPNSQIPNSQNVVDARDARFSAAPAWPGCDEKRGEAERAQAPGSCGVGELEVEYSAHDPELQRWVHATLLDSVPRTYERLVGPLSARERDRYCAEASIMEALMGMPAGWLPRDAAQLDTYMRNMLAGPQLAVSDTSRALARALLYPPHWYVAWPVFRALQVLTIGSLPAPLREAYGFEWRPRDERALARWTAAVRAALRWLPPLAREWPMARRAVCDHEGLTAL